MNLKKFIVLVLSLIIVLTAVFLYLFLTRNPLLWDIPVISRNLGAPNFLFSFGDTPGPGQLKQPMAATFDGLGNLHITDFANAEILIYKTDGTFLDGYGKHTAEEKKLASPYGIAEYNGRIYVADHGLRRIQVYSENGEFLRTLLESNPDTESGVFIPTALTVDRENGTIYVADVFRHRILVIDQQGNFIESLPCDPDEVNLSYPNGVCLDTKGNIIVADSNNARMVIFSQNGEEVPRILDGIKNGENKLSVPRGVVVDSRGNIWLADLLTHKISIFTNNKLNIQFGGLGMADGELYFPNSLELSQDGNLYVLESGRGRVSVFGYRMGSAN
jgi:sugar lactone lactonase YvrE